MSLGPRKVVDGAPPQPPLYTLFGAAQGAEEADDRWINGLLVRNYPCGPASVYDPCDTTPGLVPGDAPDADEIDPYVVTLNVQCRAAHGQVWEDIQGQARVAFAAYEYAAFETEFWTGAAIPGNRHLAQPDGVDTLIGGDPASPGDALALLEADIALSGARGMIHCRPDVASHWARTGALTKDGSRLVTILGTIVVPGYGYDGTGPDGSAPTDDVNQSWAYATGIVHARREPRVRVIPDNPAQTLNRSTNQIDVRVERAYAAGWDGCLHAAILVDRSATTL